MFFKNKTTSYRDQNLLCNCEIKLDSKHDMGLHVHPFKVCNLANRIKMLLSNAQYIKKPKL